jgi:small subunit ribosomal protein S6
MRFLTVSLDKYGVKYNEDKRNGLIGKKRIKVETETGPVRNAAGYKAEEVVAVKEEE